MIPKFITGGRMKTLIVLFLFIAQTCFAAEKMNYTVGIGNGGQALLGIDLSVPVSSDFGVQIGSGLQLEFRPCFDVGITYKLPLISKNDKLVASFIKQGFEDNLYFHYASLTYLYQSWYTAQLGAGYLLDSKINGKANKDNQAVLIVSLGFSQNI